MRFKYAALFMVLFGFHDASSQVVTTYIDSSTAASAQYHLSDYCVYDSGYWLTNKDFLQMWINLMSQRPSQNFFGDTTCITPSQGFIIKPDTDFFIEFDISTMQAFYHVGFNLGAQGSYLGFVSHGLDQIKINLPDGSTYYLPFRV